MLVFNIHIFLFNYIEISDTSDKWTFTTRRFLNTNVLVSGWSVIPIYPKPIFTPMPFPPLKGTFGKYNTQM